MVVVVNNILMESTKVKEYNVKELKVYVRSQFDARKMLVIFFHDACDVTLSVYPHRASLKNMPGHGGNQT